MGMFEQADVSVIVPCYQCANTIARVVTSIAEQTLLPAEIILVDDCSSDDTLSILEKIQSMYPSGWIKVVSLPNNHGAGMARNAGWEVATQRFIAFLDSDDSWHSQKIEIQYNWMLKHPDVMLTGHACMQVIDESLPNDIADFSDITFNKITEKQLLLKNYFSTPSVMLHRDITQRFPDGKRYTEDYHLWLTICYSGLTCCFSTVPLAYLYKAAYGEAGLSAALWKMEKGELDAYISLFKCKRIQITTLIFILGFSIVKFFKRIVISIKAK